MLWVKVCIETNPRTTCSSKIPNTGVSPVTVPYKVREAAFPRGGGGGGGTGNLEINYRSPGAVDWLAGNDNKPDSPTNKLSSFDLHTINP